MCCLKKISFILFILTSFSQVKASPSIEKLDSTLLIAKSFEKQRKYDTAIWLYKKTLSSKLITDNYDSMRLFGKIAAAYNKLTEIDSSLKYYSTAISIGKSQGKNEVLLGILYNNYGKVLHNYQKYKQAIKAYSSSLRIAEKLGNKKHIGSRFRNIGLSYKKLGIVDTAIHYYLDAKKIFIELKDSSQLGRCYNSIGSLFHQLDDFQRARDHLLNAVQILSKGNQYNFLIKTYNNLGNVYLEKNLLDSAEFFYQNALELAQEYNYRRIYLTMHNYAELLVKKGKLNKARDLLLDIYTLAEDDRNKSSMAYSANTLGKLFIKEASYDSARKYLNIGRILSKEIDDPYIIKKNLLYNTQLFQILKEHTTANSYYQELLKLNQELTAKEKKTQRIGFKDEMKYQEERLMSSLGAQIAEQKAKVAQEQLEKNNLYFFGGGSLIILVVGSLFGFIIFNQRAKRRTLEERVKSIDEAYGKIKRILHDELSADIGIASNKIEVLPTKDVETQNRIVEDLEKIRERVRNISHEVGHFEDSNLLDSLDEFLPTMENKHVGINFVLDVQPYKGFLRSIQGEVGYCSFMVLRESVRNAIKYADPSQIKILIELEDNILTTTITDDGKGFDIHKIKKGGLQNLRERVNLLKGKFEFNSDPQNGGTKIVASIPYEDESNEEKL